MACTAGGACSKTAVGGSKLNCGMPRQDPGAVNDHPSPTLRKQRTYYRSALGLRDRCGGGGAGRLGQGMRGALLVAALAGRRENQGPRRRPPSQRRCPLPNRPRPPCGDLFTHLASRTRGRGAGSAVLRAGGGDPAFAPPRFFKNRRFPTCSPTKTAPCAAPKASKAPPTPCSPTDIQVKPHTSSLGASLRPPAGGQPVSVASDKEEPLTPPGPCCLDDAPPANKGSSRGATTLCR
jgi:hypothetical protein